MSDPFLDRWNSTDFFTALAEMAAAAAPKEVAEGLHQAMKHAYWRDKDIDRAVRIGQAGIQFCLLNASGEDGYAVASLGKAMAYDTGSFTWPGWDERGITLRPDHLEIGREAARLNLRLANDLNKGEIPISRGEWLVGAFDLAEGNRVKAADRFARATLLAEKAGQTGEAKMGLGYQWLARGQEDELAALLVELEAMESGPSLAEQLRTAQRVFADPARVK